VSKKRRIYLVVRRPWESEEFPCHEERVPVRAFADSKAAEAHRAELEADFRRRNDVYPLFYQVWTDEEWRAYLATAAQIGPPPERMEYDDEWWDANKDSLTPEQRLSLWEGLPDCFAYEVIESELRD
jgi:hypothetical protein